MRRILYCLFFSCCCCAPAQADFIVSSAIIEFTQDGPRQQDIELVSRSKENDYVVSEVSEIINPGTDQQKRTIIDDPTQGGLLVTPDKTILAGGSRKIVRFVLLKNPDEHEHIYRVAIKPVIKGLNNRSSVGIKILVGYEVLVIVRPVSMAPVYQVERHGKKITFVNRGNTNVLFQAGQQCVNSTDCKQAPAIRVYSGTSASLTLPLDLPVNYSVWDGHDSVQRQF